MSRLLDEDALRDLLTSVGRDEGARTRFARDFVSLWETRVRRLTDALARRDAEEAHVVLLSIRSSSKMIGAQVIEATASLMHSSLDRQDLEGCASHLPRLDQVGQETCAELDVRFGLTSNA
jgi:HPt (histidine-containing phosphotransfer) domain-containing protein